MPKTILRPFRAPMARPATVSMWRRRVLTSGCLTLSHLPEVEIQDGVDGESCLWLDEDRREHGHVHEHAPLEEEVECPLGAIVVVPANCPCLDFGAHQRLEGCPESRFLPVPALADPSRVDVLGHVVCVGVCEEPADGSRDHGGKYEPA